MAKNRDLSKLANRLTVDNNYNVGISGSLSVTGSIVSTVTTLWSGSGQLPSGVVSGSAQTIANLPSGTVSGSAQVLNGTTIHSGSFFNGVTVVSGSGQISYTGITNVPSGIISGSSQLPSGVVSGSAQTIANLPSGTVSGSAQVDVMSTTNIARLATTGSNTFQGNQTINGSLVVTGSLTAQQFIVSSSVTYLTESFASGSHKFGDSSDDTHQFTGSLTISGSILATGTSLVSGSAQIDVMSTTNIARLATTGSNTFNGAIAIGGTNDGAGTLYVTASASRNAARLRNNDASYGTIDISNSNTSGIGIYAVANKHYLSGSLGVGTTSPSADLHISSTPGQNNPSIRLTDSAASGNGGNTYISSDKIGVGYNNLTMIAYSYTFKGGASASNYVTIDTSGNFGVGVTSPFSKLSLPSGNGWNGGLSWDYTSNGANSRRWWINTDQIEYGDFRIATERTQNGGTISSAGTLYERFYVNASGFIGLGTTSPSHKLHLYDNSASGVRGLRIATDSSTVGPTIRMDYAPGGLRNWLIGTSYEYSNDFEIRVSNANSGDPGADGSARFILWADGGYSNSARSIGNLSSTSLGGFSSANVQRWSFSSLCDNTWRTLVSNVNGIHGILKISGTDAGTKNYGEWFITFSFPGYGVMNFVGLHYSGGGWNTGGFELTYSNTGSAYFLQFRNTSYYSTGNTAGYNMEFTAL